MNDILQDIFESSIMLYTCNQALEKLRQKDFKFKASLGYTGRPLCQPQSQVIN
jgi:hypothetical protein